MNLSKLLSTEERIRILNTVLFSQTEMRIAAISKSLNLSKGFVSRFFSILLQQKILKKSKNKYFLQENINVRMLRILFNLSQFVNFNFKKYPFIKGVGLYGSCTKGENTEDSDIDVWIKIEKRDDEELAKLTSALKKVSAKISPLYLTKEKLDVLKREDLPFYNSLVHGSIRIFGEDIV